MKTKIFSIATSILLILIQTFQTCGKESREPDVGLKGLLLNELSGEKDASFLLTNTLCYLYFEIKDMNNRQ